MRKKRGSGILLHISSIPSRFGIGDLGSGARCFVDFLSDCRQSLWQILPLNPTTTRNGNSPYSTCSAFAGNPLFIDLNQLVDWGWLESSDIKNAPRNPSHRINYQRVTSFKRKLLSLAYRRHKKTIMKDGSFQRFRRDHCEWLEDFALYMALAKRFKTADWSLWPREIRDRLKPAMKRYSDEMEDPILEVQFVQYLFYQQWFALRDYCHQNEIELIGDIPIYVHYESSDVWSHRDLFKLNNRGLPTEVSGVPPDFFSVNGQLWGNPIYRWQVLKRSGYQWWISRLRHTLNLVDSVRLDHFRGFAGYWEVPAGHKTARRGRWRQGPGKDFFSAVQDNFPGMPLIAEDLGEITSEVHELRDEFGIPGMRILQFAFGKDPLSELYQPDHYIPHCVAYTGTHDNDTLMGWIAGKEDHSTRQRSEIRAERRFAKEYVTDRISSRDRIHWKFIALVMASKANWTIVPMQDLLGLGQDSRMNRPGRSVGNWEWRLVSRQLTSSVRRKFRNLTIQNQRD